MNEEQIKEINEKLLEYEKRISYLERSKNNKVKKIESDLSSQVIDFSSTPRAFFKKYNKLPGKNKFTITLAYLTKGNLEDTKNFDEIKSQWSQVKGIIGSFKTMYSTRAKDSDWVSSPKSKIYQLRPNWRDAFHLIL